MGFAAFDDVIPPPARAGNVPPFPFDPTNRTLVYYWNFLSDAEPVHLPGPDTYAWTRGAPDSPPDPRSGAIPPELYDRIVFITRFVDKFATRAGALAALQMVILEVERKSR